MMEWILWFAIPLSIILVGSTCLTACSMFQALEVWLDKKIEEENKIKEKIEFKFITEDREIDVTYELEPNEVFNHALSHLGSIYENDFQGEYVPVCKGKGVLIITKHKDKGYGPTYSSNSKVEVDDVQEWIKNQLKGNW